MIALLNYIVHRSQQIVINENVDEIITTRKRSLRRLCFHRCLSVYRGVSVCPGGSLSRWVSAQGGSLSRGSLSGRVSAKGESPSRVWVSVQEGGGGGSLFRGVSVLGLSGRVSVEGISAQESSLSRVWVSVQGVGLSRGVSVGGVTVHGGLVVHGGLCPRGSLSKGGLCRGGGETPVR